MQSHKPQLITEYEIYDLMGNLKRKYSGNSKNVSEDILTINHMTKEGIIKKQIKVPFKSYVANFGRMLQHSWFTTANGASTGDNMIIEAATGGATIIGTSAFTAGLKEAALANTDPNVYGIWIGDKDNRSGLALTQEAGIGGIIHYNDYMLRTLILNDGGSPDTGVEYRAVNVTMPDENTLLISRRFQNNGATDLIVDECGMIGKSAGTEYFLIARDLLYQSGLVDYLTVEPAEILEVSYTFTVTDASGLTSNWLKYLSSLFNEGNAVAQPKDINGAAYTVNFSTARTQQDLNAGDNADTHGIVIGGGTSSGAITAPLSAASFKLSNHLADSAIDYALMVALPISLQSSYYDIGMYRDFENDRSDNLPIYVRESAIYMKEAAATPDHYYMIARNLINTTSGYILVNRDEILRVKKYFRFLTQTTIPV